MPARFWKWRMRGAALHYFDRIARPERYDALICTDMMSVADLAGLWRNRMPPVILYFHENQLSYPVPSGERIDYHFAFTNLTGALVSDRVVFNSNFHMESFFSSATRFLRRLPEFRPAWTVDAIRAKSRVIYPGCRLPAAPHSKDATPLVIWNHRWEFDKSPEVFFDAVDRIASGGADFRLALLGENFQAVPKPFLDARRRFADRIVRYGYVEDRTEYCDWLRRGWVVVSTAIQENFGISVVEAVGAGCRPLLPNRLSYPEIIPESRHDSVLYENTDELTGMLESILTAPAPPDVEELRRHVARFSWEEVIESYDALIDEVAR